MSDAFTPASALLGGALIGLAAALLLVINGRVAGISGISWNAFRLRGFERHWRLVFLVGLLAGAGLWFMLTQTTPQRSGFPTWQLVLSALLVGIGTRLGSGCTSGHGICGLARLSKRSFIAVLVFMVTAMFTTGVMRHAF